MNTKRCTKCGIEKPMAEFYARKNSPDGRNPQCKECVKAKSAAYRKANPEKVKAGKKKYVADNIESEKEKRKAYHLANKSRLNEKSFAYRAANKEKCSALNKAYRRVHSEKLNRYTREWRLDNADEVRRKAKINGIINRPAKIAHNALRRARKLQATPAWMERTEISDLYKESNRLSELGELMHVDHIVPLQGKNVCGLHCLDNLQIITATENLKKHNSHAA